jgi:NitT/TauT family transport system substrate-binding protein
VNGLNQEDIVSQLRTAPPARKRRYLIASVVLAGSLLLSACAGESDSPAATEEGSAAETTTINVAGIPTSALAPFKLAMSDGAFEDAGLDIVYKEYAAADAVYTAYRAGGVDAGLGGIPSLANLVNTGIDRKIVFALQRTTNGMLVRSDSGIETVADLKGKKLGLFGSAIGSSANQFFALAREYYDFDPMTEASVQYGAPDLLAELLKNGDIDMALVIDPAGTAGVASGEFTNIGDLGVLLEEETGLSTYTAGWDFDTKFLEANPEAVQSFVDVNLEYQKKFNDDQSLWDSALKDLYDIQDQDVLDLIYADQKGRLVEQWGDEEKEQAQELLDFLSKNGEKDFLPTVPEDLFY